MREVKVRSAPELPRFVEAQYPAIAAARGKIAPALEAVRSIRAAIAREEAEVEKGTAAIRAAVDAELDGKGSAAGEADGIARATALARVRIAALRDREKAAVAVVRKALEVEAAAAHEALAAFAKKYEAALGDLRKYRNECEAAADALEDAKADAMLAIREATSTLASRNFPGDLATRDVAGKVEEELGQAAAVQVVDIHGRPVAQTA